MFTSKFIRIPETNAQAIGENSTWLTRTTSPPTPVIKMVEATMIFF